MRNMSFDIFARCGKRKGDSVKMQIKLKDERASVLVIFAVLLPIFLLMIGFVVDIGEQ